jgi:hypothetical protein
MVYRLHPGDGSQVVNSGIPGSPSLWMSLEDPVGTFRVGWPIPDSSKKVHLPFYGADDAWHELEGTRTEFGAWWVRHVSWGRIEVEYRQ